jgi:protein TonB
MTASLPLPSQPLSPLRIGAQSFALAIHAAALAMIILPAAPLVQPPPIPKPLAIIELAEVVRLPPPPVPPIPQPPARRVSQPVAPVPVVQQVVDTTSTYVVPAVDTADVPIDHTAVPAPPSRKAQVAYEDASSPPYPTIAIRRGWEGTVTLRVLVDTDGSPLEVEIVDSSGHTVLDRSARSHVLKRWRFQPAIQDGRLVQAWALVPVNFTLGAG